MEKAERENRVWAAHALNVEFHQIERLEYPDDCEYIIAVVAGRQHHLTLKRMQASKRAVDHLEAIAKTQAENLRKRRQRWEEDILRHGNKFREEIRRVWDNRQRYGGDWRSEARGGASRSRGQRIEGKPYCIDAEGVVTLDETEYRRVA